MLVLVALFTFTLFAGSGVKARLLSNTPLHEGEENIESSGHTKVSLLLVGLSLQLAVQTWCLHKHVGGIYMGGGLGIIH